MSNMGDHVQHTAETLEAARHSLEAAQKAHAASGAPATEAFLADAQMAYDEARSAHDLAVNATVGESMRKGNA